nr:MAG TPA: terminase small subunit [Caudoviricetes sp.]
MAKNKYYSNVQPKLELVKMWARSGLTDAEIAKNLDISLDRFYYYKKHISEFWESLKENKDIADLNVEGALYKAAMSGNVTAMIFWLKNRKGTKWREKPEETNTEDKIEVSLQIKDLTGDAQNEI